MEYARRGVTSGSERHDGHRWQPGLPVVKHGRVQPNQGALSVLIRPSNRLRRSTDGHALLCAAAEQCLALRSVPEERVDLDQIRQTGRACAKHLKQKGAHRQPSRSVEPSLTVVRQFHVKRPLVGGTRPEKWLPGITHVGPSSSDTSINR